MAEHEEVLEKFKRRVAKTEQKARECLSLLKFSEGLVKRDIGIVMIQIDLRLKKLERKALLELEKLYSAEKENIEELLASMRFLSERANSFPTTTENIKEIDQQLMKESKYIYRKRFVFETNRELNLTLAKLDTFGRIIIKSVGDTQSDIRVSSDNQVDTQIINNDIAHNTNKGTLGGQSLDIYRENESHTKKDTDIFAETDPFDILRSMQKEHSKPGIISCQKFGCEKDFGHTRKNPLENSKHVKFSDELDDTKKTFRYSGTISDSPLKERGRVVTEWERKRRTRSASPRRGHLNSNKKRDKLQGILKHKTTLRNEESVIISGKDDDTASASLPEYHDITKLPSKAVLNQDFCYNINCEKSSELKDTQIGMHKYGRAMPEHSLEINCNDSDDTIKLIQNTVKMCSSLSDKLIEKHVDDSAYNADNNNTSNGEAKTGTLSGKQHHIDMETTAKRRHISLTEKRKRNRSLTNEVIEEARNQCESIGSELIVKTRVPKDSPPNGRLRLPSFDDMLYIKH